MILLFVMFLLSVGLEFVLSLRKSAMFEAIDQPKYNDNLYRYEILDSGKSNTNSQVHIATKLKLMALYGSIVFYSYLVMFLLMTYNFGVIMSVIFGNAIGYFLFGFSEKKVRLGESSGVCCT